MVGIWIRSSGSIVPRAVVVTLEQYFESVLRRRTDIKPLLHHHEPDSNLLSHVTQQLKIKEFELPGSSPRFLCNHIHVLRCYCQTSSSDGSGSNAMLFK